MSRSNKVISTGTSQKKGTSPERRHIKKAHHKKAHHFSKGGLPHKKAHHAKKKRGGTSLMETIKQQILNI